MKNLIRTKSLILIFLGLIAGILIFLSSPVLLSLGLAFFVIYYCRKNTIDAREKKFVTYACAWAIIIRIVVSLGILIYGRYTGIGSDIFGDAMSYEGVGLYIKEIILGVPGKGILWGDNLITVDWLRQVWKDTDRFGAVGTYTVPSVAYWYGYFNILWGDSFLATKILNGILWVLGSFWLYTFFKDRFSARGSRLGFLITLFLPSAILFSSSGLKDSLLFFLIVAAIFASHNLEKLKYNWFISISIFFIPLAIIFLLKLDILKLSFIITSLFILSLVMVLLKRGNFLFFSLMLCCAALLLSSLREYLYLFVLLSGFLIVFSRLLINKMFVIVIAALAVFIFGSGRIGSMNALIKRITSESIAQSANTAVGNTAYYVYPERYYSDAGVGDSITFLDFFVSYLNGLRYIFLEPVIWTFPNSVSLFMFPEMLLFYFLLPFIVLGVVFSMRLNLRIAAALALYLFLATSLLALGQGNIGTLIRTRYMVMPFYFMIGSLGLYAAYSYIFKASNKPGQKGALS
ncbi:MAG: hypothetical protein ABIG46_02515 [Candidatus Omnitrophota bacterium]